MTNSKSTKRALFSSVVALLLCFSMLLGTTFAWFTDSAASGSNVITAGNLDIVVEYTLDGENWDYLDGATDLFQKGFWEPGHTEVVVLKITNNGSLALKYAANMNIVSEEVGKTKDGEDIVLSDILTVSTCTQQYTDGNGNIASGADIFPAMAFNGEGGVDGWIGYQTTATFKAGNVLKNDKQLQPKESDYIAVKVDMAETVGNEANHNGTDIPTINFGINVLATQYTYENDSFGKDYDRDAQYSGALNVNGNVYSLTGDVTLTDEPLMSDWTATEAYTVNGNGATVTGVVSSVDSFQWSNNGTIPAMSTIFSSADGAKVTVNDITFTGTMSSVMAGNYVDTDSDWFNTEFNNVNIVNAEVVSFSSNVSPALTVYGKLTMNNCTVTGTTLSSLDTDPMWPVYDMAIVNGSDTVINGGKIGSIVSWAKVGLTFNNVEVDSITLRGNMNTNYAGIQINEGTVVNVIDLSAVTNVEKVNISIAEGATVNKIVDNGIEYSTIEDWKAEQ